MWVLRTKPDSRRATNAQHHQPIFPAWFWVALHSNSRDPTRSPELARQMLCHLIIQLHPQSNLNFFFLLLFLFWSSHTELGLALWLGVTNRAKQKWYKQGPLATMQSGSPVNHKEGGGHSEGCAESWRYRTGKTDWQNMIQSSIRYQEGTGYVNKTVSEALATTVLWEPSQEVSQASTGQSEQEKQYRATVLVRTQRQSRKSGSYLCRQS